MLLQEGRKEQMVLKPKMAVPKRDLIKAENSKAIRQSYGHKREEEGNKRQEEFTVKIELKLQ